MNLNALNMFVLVVQHGGFTAASRKSGIATATLSRNVKELEGSLGIRLLERSTRRLRATTEGELLYQFSARGFDEIKAGQLALTDRGNSLEGNLRLSIPPNLDFWWQVLNEFQNEYPDITLDIFTSERRVDLIADGIDVALRIGELKTETAIARKISNYRHVVVASPEYISKHGTPKTPGQLSQFPCASWISNQERIIWNLGGQDYEVGSVVRVNDYRYLLALGLNGRVITELPPHLAKPYLLSGQLLQLFPDQKLPTQALNLLYLSRKYISPISRAYIDFCISYSKRNLSFMVD
ncbi:Transcriptional regulator, LysR family [hydrothermal vent metagenome]|uniref:Transcriptional regulator, LysR family n=1 Tax=hydrothermal vent metagenome TaxID=652676 RepID=A0A3B0S3U3_9ZZZZ